MKILREVLQYTANIPAREVHLFTANSVVKANGELVMGAGAAKAVKDILPNAPKVFGELTLKNPKETIYLALQGDGILGSFKTKNDWRDASSFDLVQRATDELAALAEKWPEYTFRMNYPAVGKGNLAFDDVQEIVKILPDNVILYLA